MDLKIQNATVLYHVQILQQDCVSENCLSVSGFEPETFHVSIFQSVNYVAYQGIASLVSIPPPLLAASAIRRGPKRCP